MIDLALETNFDQFFVQNNSPFDYSAVKTAMKHPRTVMAFSDAGAHVSQMSDCSITTHLLAHWVRDRQDFNLDEAVRMLTLAPARAWGFHDRGLLREGMMADINVFDPDRVAPAMPTVVHDLPAGVVGEIPLLRGYKFVKLDDRILLVSPADRAVVGEIPRYRLLP